MMNPFDKDVFKGMRKWPVPDIMQENGNLHTQIFFRADLDPFPSQLRYGAAHQVIGPQRMMQPGMHRTGIYQMCKSHLADPAQSLIKRMTRDIQQDRMIQRNKAIYRIIDNLSR